MEEYKKTAKEICVPSFFFLILASSAIFSVYAALIESPSVFITGLIFFILALIFNIIFSIYCVKKGSPKRIAFLPIVSLLLSFIITIRIIFIFSSVEINQSKIYHAAVVSVKSYRYSNMLILKIFRDESGELPQPAAAATYAGKELKLKQGDVISFTAELLELGNGGKPTSFQKNLLRKGIHYTFYIDENNFEHHFSGSENIKTKARKSIEDNLNSLFDARTVPVLKALYFGNKSYIDKSTIEYFNRAGVLHILAASGLHVGIIAGFLFALFYPLKKYKKIIYPLISALLFIYLYITDMPVSLLRACIMFYIYTLQVVFDFNRNILNTLFISALAILMIFPYELYSLGFQLSFGACFGIIVFYKIYKRILSYLPGIIRKSVSVTLSAQAMVFPILYIHLKIINIMGIISNIIIIPLMSLTLVCSIAVNIISIVSYNAGKILAPVTDLLLSGNVQITRFLSKADGHFYLLEHNYLLIPVFVLFVAPLFFHKRNRILLSGIFILSLFFTWMTARTPGTYNNKLIFFRDAGSSAALIKKDDQKILLGNISNKNMADIIIDQINRHKLRDIDIFIPEPDYKNLNNFSRIIKNNIISNCYIADSFYFSKNFRKFCELLDHDKIKLQVTAYNEKESNNRNDIESAVHLLDRPNDHLNEIYRFFKSADFTSQDAFKIFKRYDIISFTSPVISENQISITFDPEDSE